MLSRRPPTHPVTNAVLRMRNYRRMSWSRLPPRSGARRAAAAWCSVATSPFQPTSTAWWSMPAPPSAASTSWSTTRAPTDPSGSSPKTTSMPGARPSKSTCWERSTPAGRCCRSSAIRDPAGSSISPAPESEVRRSHRASARTLPRKQRSSSSPSRWPRKWPAGTSR